MAVLPAKKIATAGVLSAVAVVLGITRLGIIPWFSGASITIMHVPVVIAAVLEGPVVGLLVGLIFGVFSLIQAAIAPAGPIDVAFTNPLVSVLPRAFIGLVAYVVYRAVRGGAPDAGPVRSSAAVVAAAIAGSATNTGLVLSALSAMKFITWEVAGAVAVANGIPEAAVGAVVSLAVVGAWLRIPRKGGRADIARDEEA
jgi:uncharacterized membrane protein